MLAVYIRDEVVRPMIGDPHAHGHDDHAHDAHGHDDHAPLPPGTHQHPLKEAIDTKPGYAATGTHPADVYLPFVWSCFFFILICNLLGAIPLLGSATGNINVTGALALIAFGATLLWGMQHQGALGFWTGLVPPLDVPPALKIFLVPMMFVIEVLGLFIKHGVLAVRLFANIMGGHTVLGVILGFIALVAGQGLAERNGDTLKLRCSRELGEITTDRTKLHQILSNLLSNACKFTEDGRIEVSIRLLGEGASDARNVTR